MKVIADIHIVPIGVGASLSEYIKACQGVFEEAGLTPRLHAYGTTVEGTWETISAAIQRCHEAIHQKGAPRISTTVKLGSRTDKEESIDGRLASMKR